MSDHLGTHDSSPPQPVQIVHLLEGPHLYQLLSPAVNCPRVPVIQVLSPSPELVQTCLVDLEDALVGNGRVFSRKSELEYWGGVNRSYSICRVV